MADVGPRRGAPRSSVRERISDRGQLMLVTALSLALLFVTLALIVNTAIYTENLASRSGDIAGGTDAVRYHDAARDGVGGVVDYINANNNTSHATLQLNLSAGVDAFENHSARQFAAGDRAVETSLDSTVNGTRIAQSDTERNFTNVSAEPSWTVVEEVNHTRAFVINVTKTAFLESAGSGQEFDVTLTDGDGDTWVLNVTRDGGNTEIGITNASGGETGCSESDEPVINLSAGTVDRADCDGLVFAEGLDTPYNISFDNGDNINGTYELVVDNSSLAGNPGPHFVADGAGQPFVAHAVYSANLTVIYQTPRLYYETTVRVAPGEPDG